MTTELAFKIMICQRGIYKKLGVSSGTVGKIRYDLKHGNKISLDVKIQYLQRAGYSVIQELQWSPINQESPKKKETDFLIDYPGLTMIGRMAGKRDEVIRQINRNIVQNPSRFKIYYGKYIG